MIKKSLLLTLLLALLVPWAANAQETVTIGDGTATSNTNPIGTYYNYSITEQLYTAEEIGTAGTISSISFYYKGTAAKDFPITVYMKHVDEENLVLAGISLADADEVFSGTLSVTTTAGWVTIELDTPFAYDGTSNLLIGCIKDYLYYFSGQTWQGTATTSYMARYTQSDSAGPYTTSTVPSNTQDNRPNIQLVIEPASSDCPKPNNLVASNVTAHTADLTWESEATQFMLQYKKVSDESWNSVYLEDEGTSYQLTNLVAETEYNVRVAAHIESCGSDPQTGDDIYSDWRTIDITTGIACPAPTNLAVTPESITAHEATVTWEGSSDSYVVMIGEENLAARADFETGDLSQANFTTTTAYPFTAVANTHSGAYCAKSSNDGVNSSTSDMVLEVTLSNDATLTFSAKVSSEASWDKAYFSIDGTNKINAISGSGSWIDYSYPLAAGTHTLRWYYTKDSSTHGNDDCFYVDDIVISAGVASWTEYTTNNTTYTFNNLTPNRSYQAKVKGNCGDDGFSQESAPVSFTTLESCVTPTGLTVSNITGHEATISWTSAADAWQICVNDDEENLIDVTETTYNFTGLTPETTYTVKVRTDCGNEYSDWTNNVSFTTLEACPAPTGFAVAENGLTGHTATLNWQGTSNSYQVAYRTTAYVDGFEEGFSNSPTGWLFRTGALNADGTATLSGTSSWTIGTNCGVFDSHIYMNMYSTKNYWLITPSMEIKNGDALSFDMAYTKYSSSNTNNAPVLGCTTHRFVVLISVDDMTTWTILREWNNSGSEYVLDQVSTSGENSGNIDLSAYAGQTAYIAFFGHAEVTNYDNNFHFDNVAIGTPVPAGEMQYASNITEQTVTLQGLLAETEYEAWLQGDCGSEGLSTEVGPISFTTDVACPAPTGLAVSNITGHEATINWTSAAEAWQICVNNDEENLIDVTETTYNFTGLAPETTYTVKVRANCGDEGYSDWTNNVTFTTEEACPMDINNVTVNYITNNKATVAWEGTHDNYQVQYRTPETSQIVVSEGSYYDDFENGLDNWTIYQEGEAGGNWSITDPSTWSGSYAAHSGSYVAVARSWSGSPFNADNWLVSPQVTIPATMSYWMKGDSGYPETYDICVSTTGNAVADFTSVVTYNTNPDDWTLVTVDLSAYEGQTGYIAFHQYGYDADFLWIDDVNIGCATVVTPAGEWITIETADLAAELTGLEASTTYEYQVRGYCADEDTWTDWTNMASFTTDKAYYWNDPETWTNDTVPADYADVTIPAHTMVIIPDGYTAFADTISFGEGASIYIEDGGQLYHSNEIPVMLQMNVLGYSDSRSNNGGYSLIASPVYTDATEFTIPVDSTNLNMGTYDLYAFNQNYQGAEWRNFKAGEFTTLTLGQGYLYADSLNHTVLFAGQTLPTNADKDIDLDYNSAVNFKGWNLVGNPFTCMAYVDRPFYTMTAEGDAIVEVNMDEHSVEVMQGIFVVADSTEVNPVVTFTTTEPTRNAYLALNLSQGRSTIDRAIVRFDEGRTLPKLQLNPNHTKVYIPMNGEDYAVASAAEMGEMPVSFKAENNGTYTFSANAEEVSFSYLHLIDNMTGADVDLLQTSSYTFNARTTDYANRFKLVFATGNNSNDDNFAFFSNGNLVINNEGKATLQVIDVTGRILSSETVNGSTSIRVNAAAGVYMLRLINGNNVKVQKIVVR